MCIRGRTHAAVAADLAEALDVQSGLTAQIALDDIVVDHVTELLLCLLYTSEGPIFVGSDGLCLVADHSQLCHFLQDHIPDHIGCVRYIGDCFQPVSYTHLDVYKRQHYENTLLITDGEPEILTAPAI